MEQPERLSCDRGELVPPPGAAVPVVDAATMVLPRVWPERGGWARVRPYVRRIPGLVRPRRRVLVVARGWR